MPDTSLLWPDQRPSRPGPKPRMTLEKVVDAAIAIADSQGLAGVSMQQVAGRLDAKKMSLYRYVPGKRELTALMLDTALGSPPARIDEVTSWRAGLATWAMCMHTTCTAHPWALELSTGARVLGPNELAWTEAAMRHLKGTPLHAPERLDVLALLAGHVRGIVAQHATAAEPERGIGELMSGVLSAHATEYPETAAAFASSADSTGRDNALAFGIERILDGVSALITDRDGGV